MSSRAYANPKIAVLDLEVIENGKKARTITLTAKELSDKLRAQVDQEVNTYELAPNSAKSLLQLKLLSDCSDEGRKCMSEIGKELGADRLLYGRIEHAKKKYKITLQLLNTNTSTMEKQITKQVTQEKLHGNAIVKVAKALYTELLGLKAEGTLQVNANVEKATVYIDGKVATTIQGNAAKILGLREGLHTIIIESSGHHPYEAQVSIKPGHNEELSVSLIKISVPSRKKIKDDKSNPWKMVFASGAIMSAGLGGAWAYSAVQYGFLGGGYEAKKTRLMKKLQSTNDPVLTFLHVEGSDYNACKKGYDKEGPEAYRDLRKSCKQGEKWAKRSTYLAVATGIISAATILAGYKAFFSKNSSKEAPSHLAKKKSTFKNIIVVPHVDSNTVGAELSLEF